MRSSFVCEHPAHIGPALVSKLDLLEERTEWRTLTDQNRFRTRITRRVCKDCCRRDVDPVKQEGML